MAAARLRRIAFATTLVLGCGLAVATDAGAAQQEDPVRVTVNTRAGLATVPDTALGINHAVWDSQLGTPEVADLLGSAGLRMMRYPGGSYGDIYHWETHTAPGGFVAPNTDFDTFMGGVRRAGGQAMVIANYGTGSPEEAAGWVRHANIERGYGVRYWEIGNELYGNGHYGAEWEADNHPDKSPTGYATEVVRFATAMKAVDPTIKIGAVLTTPANWPDGVVAEGDPATWNQTVLSIAGPHVDFVILHWYPGGATAPETLSKPDQIDDIIYLVREQIARFAGPNAGRLGIALTEMNTSVGRNTQPGALFAAESYAGLLENGVFTVQWWNTHNGIGNVSTVAGHTDYDDFGLLSSANCTADGSVCQPALNTPFAPYHALRMMNLFVRPGDQFVRAATGNDLVSAHAARRPNGELALLLLNKDPDNAQQVVIDYAGFVPAAGAPTVHTFTNGATGVSTAQSGTATAQTLPPYSLTTLVLRPAANRPGAPGAPGAPTAAAVTDRSATISWPAATPGARPIAKYEVYRHNGVTSEQWGETPGTAFTAHNLVPGSRYTVNVLARDTAGAVSWASPPLTVTTGAPAASTCAVRFTDVTNWGSGFVASVDITNTGSSAVNGWTLTFRWPTGWQQMGGGWNGTWAQDGTTVTVSNADFNRELAANGGSANVGFVGNYSGPNVLPGSFTLNGTVCAAG
ncbi:MAG TPA: cellulose binding domain-containing protein [Actinophytocola sp.]|uniref:cellulose binding domain-containing protein n=1 Tax=Actinophytocola sp. TaxID=1872138 RepID=UPI002DB9637C|nr:cellulose binding domain-containing protein [Actinophytocola sp.]HEU5472682.1 cellulose binding domain-containing protein [Actinophytocola sp.]